MDYHFQAVFRQLKQKLVMGILQNISLYGCLNYTHYSTHMFITDFLNIFILSTNLLSKKNFLKKKEKKWKAEGKKEEKKRRKKERKKKGKKKKSRDPTCRLLYFSALRWLIESSNLVWFCWWQEINGSRATVSPPQTNTHRHKKSSQEKKPTSIDRRLRCILVWRLSFDVLLQA